MNRFLLYVRHLSRLHLLFKVSHSLITRLAHQMQRQRDLLGAIHLNLIAKNLEHLKNLSDLLLAS